MSIITDPLTFQFMQRAFIAAILVGALCGVVGTYVVVRGMSFFGDAIAHTILPGVAVAFIWNSNLFLGGLAAGLISAVVIGWLTNESRMKEDTAIGVVFVTMFALGIAIISSTRSYSTDLAHILFGNVLGVNMTDIWILVGSGIVVMGFILALYKELLVLSFDETLMRTLKMRGNLLRILLLVLIALTIVASLQTVGISLVLAMLITPAATAQMLTKRLHIMMGLAALIGSLSGIIGLYVSYYVNIASGAAIVLTASAFFVSVFVIVNLFNIARAAPPHAPDYNEWHLNREQNP